LALFCDDPGLRQFPGATVAPIGCASHNAWLLGLADVAREREARMMASVDQSNPYDLAFSALHAAGLRAYLREYEQVEALAARALEISEKDNFPLFTSLSRCFLALARAQLGRATEGVALLRQGISGMLAVGARLGITVRTPDLAEAQEREGAIVDALATVDEALKVNPGELVHQPEILRLRGEMRLKQGQTELAETGFREAVSVARSMGAKAWELRATMSLARLLREIGRGDEARSMLAEIYGRFTEGFDTADLKDAKALLDELGA